MSFTESVKFSWTTILLILICLLVFNNSKLDFMETGPPVWLLGFPPVVKAEHDGEGAGGQHLLVVVVIQAVSRCEGKSVANLRRQQF